MGILQKKTGVETATYEYENGFMVDVIKSVADDNLDLAEVWLYHKDYGIKEHLFSIEMEEPLSEEEILDFVEESLENESFIENYKEDVMEEE